MRYPIPKQAADIYISNLPWENAGLVFDRYVPIIDNDQAKQLGLNQVIKTRRNSNLRQALLKRWQAGAAAVGAKIFELKTDWRLVSGVGRNTPYEVGFRFDRYGFATLPGSSVKGVARAYALLQIAEALGVKTLEKLDDQVLSEGDNSKSSGALRRLCPEPPPTAEQLIADFRTVFGTTAAAGCAIFLDAMPVDDPKLELDVMNPHFPNYYQGGELPVNWQNPVPITFLAVAADVRFAFAVGWRGQPAIRLQELAQQWLVGGLTELGAGAKTNAGYGYFAKPKLSEPTVPQSVSLHPKQTQPQPGQLKQGSGRLRRQSQRVWIQDGEQQYTLSRDYLAAAYDTLPADKTDVTYEYDEAEGKRRVWKVIKKPSTKGL